MSKQTLTEKIEDQVSDVVDAINEWDDFIERHKPHFSAQEYAQLIAQNDLAYQEALKQDQATDTELVAA